MASFYEAEPELPAHHFTEAGMPEEAENYGKWAGERAILTAHRS